MSYEPEFITFADATKRIAKLPAKISFFLMVGQRARTEGEKISKEHFTGCAQLTKKAMLEWLQHSATRVPTGALIAVDFPKADDEYSKCCFVGQSA